jgi:hypothetical protein
MRVPLTPTVDHIGEHTKVGVDEQQILLREIFRRPIFEVGRRARSVSDGNPLCFRIGQRDSDFLAGIAYRQ